MGETVVCPGCLQDIYTFNEYCLDHFDKQIELTEWRMSNKSPIDDYDQAYINTLSVLLARRHILEISLRNKDKSDD